MAIKLPFIVYGKVKIILGKNAQVIIDAPLKTGLLKLGYRYELLTDDSGSTLFKLYGTLRIKGTVHFGTACKICISKGAVLEMGEMSSLGTGGRLTCAKKIVFSDYTRIGYESVLADSNFHYMIDLATHIVRPMEHEIVLGSYNYFGGRVVILGGTKTPDHCTISTLSLCNKDYTITIPPNSVIGGIPAKLVKSGYTRIFDFQKEGMIRKYFEETDNEIFFDED